MSNVVSRDAKFHRKITAVAIFNMTVSVPVGALRDRNGTPILDRDGKYIIIR